MLRLWREGVVVSFRPCTPLRCLGRPRLVRASVCAGPSSKSSKQQQHANSQQPAIEAPLTRSTSPPAPAAGPSFRLWRGLCFGSGAGFGSGYSCSDADAARIEHSAAHASHTRLPLPHRRNHFPEYRSRALSAQQRARSRAQRADGQGAACGPDTLAVSTSCSSPARPRAFCSWRACAPAAGWLEARLAAIRARTPGRTNFWQH